MIFRHKNNYKKNQSEIAMHPIIKIILLYQNKMRNL